MTGDERQADLLDGFWAALLAETGERSPAELDPALAIVALCLAHDLPAPEPDPRFSERLRSLLLNQARAPRTRAKPANGEAGIAGRRNRAEARTEQTAESRKEYPMATSVRQTIRDLTESTLITLDALFELADAELGEPSSHVCAQGKDVWTLITNDIDHEKIHVGQILEARYEARITQSHMHRLIAEWLMERSRLIGSLVGLSDEELNQETAPGGWTYRAVAKHTLLVEQDSLKNLREAIACRAVPEPAGGGDAP